MKTKQSPPRPLAQMAQAVHSAPGLNANVTILQEAIHKRKDSGSGRSPLIAKVFKCLLAHSVHQLCKVISQSTKKPFIEPCIRIIMHLPLKKRPPVHTEEDTRPIVLEEEVAKIICLILLLQANLSFEDTTQSAYQKGRSTLEGRKVATFAFAHALENHSQLIIYKRDKTNAYGTVDSGQLAAILTLYGMPVEGASWFQQYVQQALIQSVTQYGTSPTWAFGMGVFQGNPLGPLSYLIQEDIFHQKIQSSLIPSLFGTQKEIIPVILERYSFIYTVPTGNGWER